MTILRLDKTSLNLEGKQILKGINLSVEGGTIHSILGSNAAGKTSLAYLIMGCGEYIAQSGKICFMEMDITNLSVSERARLGITLAWQEPARFEGLTVRDYISVGMPVKNDLLIRDALGQVLLDSDSYLDRGVDKTLSGGERKRIELAAIFAMQPKLVIMDEPDSGIDILALDHIVDMIKKLKAQGSTVVLITHRQEVAEIADRTSLICSGCLVKEGKPNEVSAYFKEKCIPCPTKNISCPDR